MIKKSTLATITTILSAVGINVVPAAGFFGLGWGWSTTMLLYLLETLVGILLVALRIRLLAPAQEEVTGMSLPGHGVVTRPKPGQKVQRYVWPTANGVLYDRTEMLKSYLVIAVSLSVGAGLFIATFLFLLMRVSLEGVALRSGLAGILTFQLIGLLSDLVGRRSLSLVQAEKLGE